MEVVRLTTFGPFIKSCQVTHAGTESQSMENAQIIGDTYPQTNGAGTWIGPPSTDAVHAVRERAKGNPTGAPPGGDTDGVDKGTQPVHQRTGLIARGVAVEDVPNLGTQSQGHDQDKTQRT